MGEEKFTIQASVDVRAKLDDVWRFTQNWTRRPEWDRMIRSAEFVEEDGKRVVHARGQGGSRMVFRYAMVRRATKYDPTAQTSLLMEAESPAWLSGSGSWLYEPLDEGGTRWTQFTAINIESRFFQFFSSIIRWQLAGATQHAMAKAKEMIEAESDAEAALRS